jgi:bidirectional [NiFe] hydrogenase diaphorase subunit
MTRIRLLLDGREVPASPDRPLLWAALDAGVRIPNLCAVRDALPDGNCRLCWVGVEGAPEPVLSCAVRPTDGMVVRTDAPAAVALRRTAFELLLAAHAPTCAGCAALRTCELLRIARAERRPVRTRRFALRRPGVPADERHPAIRLDPERCVWCGRCVVECARVRPGDPLLEFAFRGPRTVLSTFRGAPLPDGCAECMRCVDVCPAAGLTRRAGAR